MPKGITGGNIMLTSKRVAALAAKTLDDKIAKNIKILEVRDLTVLTEYFIICTANSTSQVKTLGDEVCRILEENGETPLRTEGVRTGGWVLVDFGCVVIHIFLEEARQFYNLERLWGDAPEIEFGALMKEEGLE